jgi:hypothetical protein
MNEEDIWQVIQTGNEISVMRIEAVITITVGVLVISTLNAIRLNLGPVDYESITKVVGFRLHSTRNRITSI